MPFQADLLTESIGVDQFLSADGDPVEHVEQAQLGEFPGRVGEQVDPDAEFTDLARLLERVALDPDGVQAQCRGVPADPAADDQHPRRVAHVVGSSGRRGGASSHGYVVSSTILRRIARIVCRTPCLRVRPRA
jgi:hypothetical protein